MGEFIKYLDKTKEFDFYMPLDCDEFVVTETTNGEIKCDSGSIFAELINFKDNLCPLAIKGSYFNIPNSSGEFYFYPEDKLFFCHKTFEWMDEGFHTGRTRVSAEPTRTNICHLHYSNKPYAMALRHAKEKLEGLVPDFEPETMRSYEGSVSHLKRFFLRSESEYETMHTPTGINHLEFKKVLTALGLRTPFSNHWPTSAAREKTISGAIFWSNGRQYTFD